MTRKQYLIPVVALVLLLAAGAVLVPRWIQAPPQPDKPYHISRTAAEYLLDARTYSSELTDRRQRVTMAWRLALAHARIGTLDDAMRTALGLESAMDRADVLIRIAEIRRQLGDSQGARKALTQAEQVLPEFEQDHQRLYRSSEIAAALAEAGDPAWREAWRQTRANVDAARIGPSMECSYLRIAAMGAIAGGDREAAIAILREGEQIAMTARDALNRDACRLTLARAWAGIGDVNELRRHAALYEEGGRHKLHAACLVVAAQAESGDLNSALAAVAAARHSDRPMLLNAIVIALLKRGDLNGASAVAAPALTPEERAVSFAAVASAYARKGDTDAAKRALAIARKADQSSEHGVEPDMTQACGVLLAALSRAGNFTGASHLIAHMKSHQATAYAVIAAAQLEHGDTKAARETVELGFQAALASHDGSTELAAIGSVAVKVLGHEEFNRKVRNLADPDHRASACLGAALGLNGIDPVAYWKRW